MRFTFKCCVGIGLSLIVSMPAPAQSNGPATPDAAGGSKNFRGITHEYAIGQVVAGDSYNAGVLITPGVLQPSVPARNTGNQIAASELQIFPDPVDRTLFLLPAFRQGGTLEYALFDAAGSLVVAREAILKDGTERQELPVGHIAAGQYFLKVTWVMERTTPKISGYKIQKLP